MDSNSERYLVYLKGSINYSNLAVFTVLNRCVRERLLVK